MAKMGQKGRFHPPEGSGTTDELIHFGPFLGPSGLAVGWRLMAVGGWRRLMVVGWWRLAVDGGWRLSVGSWQLSGGERGVSPPGTHRMRGSMDPFGVILGHFRALWAPSGVLGPVVKWAKTAQHESTQAQNSPEGPFDPPSRVEDHF